MTMHQEHYNARNDYQRLTHLRPPSGDRRRRREKSPSPRRSGYHGQASRDEGKGHVTPSNPDRLSSGERRSLLQIRIKQLEENERKILELQLKDRASQQPSRYSERSRGPSIVETVAVEAPKYYFTKSEYQANKSSSRTYKSDISEPVSSRDKLFRVREETEDNMNESAAIKDISRQYRASILNKAERMINERNRKQGDFGVPETHVSRVQEYVNEQQQMYLKQQEKQAQRTRTFVAKRSGSPPSDSEYIEVPEEVDNETEISSAYQMKAKGFSRWSGRDAPSAIQELDRLRSAISLDKQLQTQVRVVHVCLWW